MNFDSKTQGAYLQARLQNLYIQFLDFRINLTLWDIISALLFYLRRTLQVDALGWTRENQGISCYPSSPVVSLPRHLDVLLVGL
jgi:hypothetical protein